MSQEKRISETIYKVNHKLGDVTAFDDLFAAAIYFGTNPHAKDFI